MNAASGRVAILLLPTALPAVAQTATDASHGAPTAPEAEPAPAASPLTITGSAAIVTQYRFRGISQPDNKPVVQGAFTAATKPGFHVSLWGSSASGNDAVNIGGTEIDVYGGYIHALGKSGATVDDGLYGYLYPGSRRAVGICENYYETDTRAAKTVVVGSVTASF